MVERLQHFSNELADQNPFDNVAQAAKARANLEARKGSKEEPRLQFVLARELLGAGRTQEALERLDSLYEELTARSNGEARFLHELGSWRAIAMLRIGEERNCIARHGEDSCLMPIRGGGVHVDQEGSRNAIAAFRDLLEEDPDDLRSRWLLNLAYMTVGEYPDGVPDRWRIDPEAFASEHEIERFHDVAGAAGLATEGHAGGCIVDDFDGDGDLDVMVSSMGLEEIDQLRYFENLADGTFADRTKDAGLLGLVGGLNITSCDFDNDADLDVLVLRGGWVLGDVGRQPNSLLRNDGEGRFTDVTRKAGIMSHRPTQTAAIADYDNDGWLDIFIGNEATPTAPHACELYHNNGDGTFTDVAEEAGVTVLGFVKGAVWGDYDNDGRVDLFVARNGHRPTSQLFHNEGPDGFGSWRFRDVTAESGVRGSRSSFATWFFDYDNDGWLDLYIAGYECSHEDVVADYVGVESSGPERGRPSLYHNNGDGTFTDVARDIGLDHALMTMGCNYGDLDNDGWLDFYLGTGQPDFRTLVPNRMFRNERGLRFEDVTTSGGFGHLQKGHGVSFADIDNDGDQDVFAVMGGALTADSFRNALFENPGNENRWIGLELEGTVSNRDAIGARVRVRVDNGRRTRDVYATVSTGSSFGVNPRGLRIGLGSATRIESVLVTWPSGTRTELSDGLELDRVHHLLEGNAEAEPVERARIPLGGGSPAEECCTVR